LDNILFNHSKKYYWLNNDFTSVEYLSPQYFFKKTLDLLKNKDEYREEKRMRASLPVLNSRKNNLIKKYKLKSKTVNTLNFLSILGNLRDERKSNNQMAGNVLYKFAQEFQVRTSIDKELIQNICFWEMEKIFTLKKDFLKILAKRMANNFIVTVTSTKHYNFLNKNGLFLNNYINRLINSNSDLKGMPACKGLVSGTVKIIRDKNDFHKMKKGDILVAPNTRPEYVPVMKLASAIVTEEGGITCHAAIVSRELKIPCVVGVQGIISRLKDNNKIEVNANEGEIKIFN